MATQLTLPTHLCVFVTYLETGQPVAQLPVYAEIALPKIKTAPPLDSRLRESILAALIQLNNSLSGEQRQTVAKLASEIYAVTIDNVFSNQLVTELRFDRIKEFFYTTFKVALEESRQQSLINIPPTELAQYLESAMRRVGTDMNFSLSPKLSDTGTIWAESLGVLVTDHVGYLSFDLRQLNPQVQKMLIDAITSRQNDQDANPTLAIWIYPYGTGGKFNALQQGRFTEDAIVALLQVDPSTTFLPALPNFGGRALQNPGLTDWRLSPASFAANPSTLLGSDSCEQLMPANLALQEFLLRQVVRLATVPDGFNLPAGYKAAYVDEYKVSWYSLGHSLGEILYSLPLAPGETVKLSVIDWSWDSLVHRDETTKLTEEILHQTHRDRTITETVKAGVKEFQHGSSFIGGVGNSIGATGVFGPVTAAIGNVFSLGGSTASSSGSRDLAAENVQRINDSFAQASSAQREINSTVVIQTHEEQQEKIQTRTFSNYNHSHTLTVLYYEVLRHFKVSVEWVRRRPAILAQVPRRISNFDSQTLLNNRSILEPVLLDPGLKAGFDAIEKMESIRSYQVSQNIVPGPLPIPFWQGEVEFNLFEVGIHSLNKSMDKVVIYAISRDQSLREKRHELHRMYYADNYGDPYDINAGQRMDEGSAVWTLVRPFDNIPTNPAFKSIKWKDLIGFEIEKWGDNAEWAIDWIKIDAFDNDGNRYAITSPDGRKLNLRWFNREPNGQSFTWIDRPPYPPVQSTILSPEQSMNQEDNFQIKKLLKHVEQHKEYYNRVILLSTDTDKIINDLDALPWSAGQTLADNVDPTPLETFGNYIAYPLSTNTDSIQDVLAVEVATALNSTDLSRRQWAIDKLAQMTPVQRQEFENIQSIISSRSERLITLPTRGVFAEGKLGHCQISEEIDNTRFWKWEKHPIPIVAPDINPATPITPQPQQISATPTAFPQSLVNIVNPSATPDPTGLSAALNLLGSANLFRDMSGRQEVADLLKKVVDGSISIADVANKAREIQSKYGTNLDGTGTKNQPGGNTVNRGTQQPKYSNLFQNVEDVNSLATGIREQLSPGKATPIIEQLYKKAVDQTGSNGNGTSQLITDPTQLTGSLTPTSIIPFTGGQHLCFPVSMFQDVQFASGFGTIAERMIEADYCETMSCSAASTYIDKNNPTEYIDFLKSHNPTLGTNPDAPSLPKAVADGIKRPDILCDDGTRKDFYEIKPMSVAGAAAGVAKLAFIKKFMSQFSLPYVAGEAYTPSKEIPILAGNLLGEPISVTLNVQRYVPGIITYTICLQGNLAILLGKISLAAILAWIATQLLTTTVGGVLVV
ncbi:hypothetical protein CLV59_105190 [Chitinophaga dinghuensis]|uniref:Uncharacterized protein n=1 Tax=Chitinophaga dinghuensis TaxID=1539050 RepID=A0A327VXM2_9BACT|nr:hypothetical protein [Chitinophaga dinghuensis]RAJ80083.1 hypothetical protein CLV59_105190 [Chitinophaga dinghuensis]